jgi:hypothetical protein
VLGCSCRRRRSSCCGRCASYPTSAAVTIAAPAGIPAAMICRCWCLWCCRCHSSCCYAPLLELLVTAASDPIPAAVTAGVPLLPLPLLLPLVLLILALAFLVPLFTAAGACGTATAAPVATAAVAGAISIATTGATAAAVRTSCLLMWVLAGSCRCHHSSCCSCCASYPTSAAVAAPAGIPAASACDSATVAPAAVMRRWWRSCCRCHSCWCHCYRCCRRH